VNSIEETDIFTLLFSIHNETKFHKDSATVSMGLFLQLVRKLLRNTSTSLAYTYI